MKNVLIDLHKVEIQCVSGGMSDLDIAFAIALGVLVNGNLKTKNPGVRAVVSAASSIMSMIVAPKITAKLIEPNPYYERANLATHANNTVCI